MPKRRKKPTEEVGRLVPHEDLIRKSISTGLIQTGIMLDLQSRSLQSMIKLDQVRALSGKEHQFLQEAVEAIERAERICIVIGERNQRVLS